ncbi:MAG TPA: hypothetical protein VGV37_06415 [Aliidongia sp.]|uniref:hypothetical protein n=1 Tax=Aliidongia sp. TaxID=1914230 RepID=UPI002DDD801E|nr:hypothetical protein [Aliidongia sp.]HEV2674159.1 hypothetical protein [Aliidongia sp.]
MAVPKIIPSFSTGEISPKLLGRVDFAKEQSAAGTMRNMWVAYQGGATSRAGTKFSGYSKQTGRAVPPRLITFQFSINQGLALEFGNEYMRVLSNGEFVTNPQIAIAGASQFNPATITFANTQGVSAATANNGGVTVSYAPGDQMEFGGGTYTSIALLQVTNTKLLALLKNAGGTGYVAGDTIHLAGGVQTTPVVLTVNTVTAGAITTFTITNPGVFASNAPGGKFTQASTSGSGTGATFQAALFGPNALSVVVPGAYSVVAPSPAPQIVSSGLGQGVTFTLTFAPVPPVMVGDWISVAGVRGMTQLNGQTFVAASVVGSVVTLEDVFGNPIDSTGFDPYVSGGTGATIYTMTTPWGEDDLVYLKWTQSADVMSICCVNQKTGTEYPPQDLKRITDSNWTIAPPNFSSTIAAPSAASGTTTGAGTTDYQYVVTAINTADGTESNPSPIADVPSSVNIATVAGAITIAWNPVAGASSYNIYKAPPAFMGTVPAGSLFGFAGQAFGAQFIDNNITADFQQTPPQHENPFARNAIIALPILNPGTNITAISSIVLTSATGSGFSAVPVVVGGQLVAAIIEDGGQDYVYGVDTLTITGVWDSPPSVTYKVGPGSGTYPGVVAYFQERRVYGSSTNQPDTYWFSQPGAFTNFDARTPTIDSDAITGTPWSVEVNGIQWMISMPGGLVVLTGLGAWQLTGAGGSSLNPQPITPANQQAQPQAYNGCSATIMPIKIDYDIIFNQAKGSIFRDISYNFFTNIYTGTDLTELSSHLFTGYTFKQAAWCEEPYKLMWAVRDDGSMLSMTYLKVQEVQGWARHDTQGLFQSICSVTEPPVDALYLAVERTIDFNTSYMIERMDNRIWSTAEDCWCVDAGLSLAQPAPPFTLTADSASGAGAIANVSVFLGGQDYSGLTTASIVDDDGQGAGTGCTLGLTIVGGIITGVAVLTQGKNYSFPVIVLTDPTGAGQGAVLPITLDTSTVFTASGPAFQASDVGSVIRMGGGIAQVLSFFGPTQVVGNILSPIVATVPSTSGMVQTQPAGSWTITPPTQVISGLNHLANTIVTGVADGNVLSPRIVTSDGRVFLDQPSSAVTVGLGFKAQIQSVQLDTGAPTVQGQRKAIKEVTARMEMSRGVVMGANQRDGSTLSPPQIDVPWRNLDPVPDYVSGAPRKPFNALCAPLYTGDRRIPVKGGFSKAGQVCMQQSNPLPMNVLAFVPQVLFGDTPEESPQPRNRGRQQ